MKSCFRIMLLTLLPLICGCEVIRLSNGKYEIGQTGRGDFAAVYHDMIIIRLRNPEEPSGTENGYWDWGGEYSVRDDGVIELDMDRQTARDWNFYYSLRKQDNAIRVIDHRAEKSFRLEHVPAVPPQQRRGNAPAVPADYPAFQ